MVKNEIKVVKEKPNYMMNAWKGQHAQEQDKHSYKSIFP